MPLLWAQLPYHQCICRDSTFVEHISRKLATNVTLVPGDLNLCQVTVAKAFDPLHCFNRYSWDYDIRKNESKLLMTGMCNPKRKISALIRPLYHPLQTRPTLPFPHIGNNDLLLLKCNQSCLCCCCKFTGFSLWPGTSLPACASTGGLWAPPLLSLRPSGCIWDQTQRFIFSTFQIWRVALGHLQLLLA